MSYTPTEWKKGDIVTSDKMNKLEQGVADAGGNITFVTITLGDQDVATLGNTWQEIFEASNNGVVVLQYVVEDPSYSAVMSYFVIGVTFLQGTYTVSTTDASKSFTTDSANGYPSTGNK